MLEKEKRIRYVSPSFAVSCCSGWDLTDGWLWCGWSVVLFSCFFCVGLSGWLCLFGCGVFVFWFVLFFIGHSHS